ncbi:hypothetical protein [Amycolatopsis sp. NPDC059021]|uniref:hypothetical protein n=1 Tax=Amycolatopsis sp. NPDC059021 TaxID=3346704 RepID=UPI00366D3973
MPLLTRLRRSARAGKNGAVSEIGDVVVVHAGDGGTDEARTLAASLAADPEHQVVVADLPPESPVELWESFAAALPRDKRPLRLIPGRQPLEIGAAVAPWLTARLGRPVLAPYGRVHQGAAGALFVHSGPRTGWGWFRPRQSPAWAAKRFPSPAWESPVLAEVAKAGAKAVAEPLPAGMWIHPAGADEKFARERLRLAATLPCQPGTPVIVLGSNDVPGLELGDVAAFWRTLPPEVRGSVWFVLLGGIAVPEGSAAGLALANAIGAEALCYNGFPVGSPDTPEVVTTRPDGGQGWSPFGRGFAYRPGDARPRLRAHRAPAEDLHEIVPGVYRSTPDVVVEIVQAGLWVRSLEGTGEDTGGAARSVPVDPACALVLYEATDPAKSGRLRAAAEELVKGLDPAVRPTTRVLPIGTPVGGQGEPTARLPTASPLEDELGERTTRLTTTPPKGEQTARLAAPPVDGQSESTARVAPVAARPGNGQEELTTRMAVRAVPSARPEDKPDALTTRLPTQTVQPKDTQPENAAPPEEKPEQPVASAEPEDGELADTALPFLSRMMETVVMPVPASLRAAEPGAPSPAPSRLSARLEGHTDERGH